eukprot:MONOS_4694.1-p1 / transcript=MONOS_4694.1 / gene=MONOS_4694 / organism=Monocercomonoides_exilis_PA203 / gene_product=unspecified product / transcript_product=unspecified product / location=Mono_scaffold00127:107044-107761(-) / protein_length=185 / sequence_SO=supercontig / SO=protein_coding / is_pseudo=false
MIGQQMRNETKKKTKLEKKGERLNEYEIVPFIQKLIKKDNVEKYTYEQALDLIEKFVHRHDDELKLIDERRKTGKHVSTSAMLQADEWKKEIGQIHSGIEGPDLLNPDCVVRLRIWNGDKRSINLFPMRVYRKPSAHFKKESPSAPTPSSSSSSTPAPTPSSVPLPSEIPSSSTIPSQTMESDVQ